MNKNNREDEIIVTVKFFADLKQYGPDKEKINLPRGSKVQNVIEKYNVPLTKNLIILINGLPHKKREDIISDGDIIAIFPPIAGG